MYPLDNPKPVHPMSIFARVAVVGTLTVGAVAGLAACNPLSYGCSRQGSHGVVVCHNTNHNPNASARVVLAGSSWS